MAKLDTERTISRFAWWPVRIGSEVRWLERVHIKQWYEGRLIDGYLVTRWFNIKFYDYNFWNKDYALDYAE